MGDVIARPLLFPAPDPEKHAQEIENEIVWDTDDYDGGAFARRPFLWLTYPESPVALVYFHGNGVDLGVVANHLRSLRKRLCANILGVEYPGYGVFQPEKVADGSLCMQRGLNMVEAIDEAAVHGLKYLIHRRGFISVRVLLHGHSMGTGPALRLAQRAQEDLGLNLGGIILQSPFSSIAQVVTDHAGTLGSCVVPNYYDNLEALRYLCLRAREQGASDTSRSSPRRQSSLNMRLALQWTPLLIVHGEKDAVVRACHGRALLEEARRCGHPAVEGVFLPTATHCRFEDIHELTQPMLNFMHSHLGVSPRRTNPGDATETNCKRACLCRTELNDSLKDLLVPPTSRSNKGGA
mmetsp:Transcript_46394/g.92040  ORF Transcript_46394/g.92040 Transcript_46394/m.92040 type:complete len:351 (+) Transcript_46394:66-1118(+)|eukprot:CAMPEP_0172668436 /NCGR_PEP_ID=MMETSP1074-20121228/9061_1 /TAXON_ID=2916 /ORGANISM="Ceratium fusus, Strain PA161109" /LENGTH=350 /DNA_ID=CAMNT_0013485085 /DNA_START=51 /DNA_END=1103 /DNA_ORIENTATION=+